MNASTWIMLGVAEITDCLEIWTKTKGILIEAKDWDGLHLLNCLVRDKVKDAHMRGLLSGEEVAELDRGYRLSIWS